MPAPKSADHLAVPGRGVLRGKVAIVTGAARGIGRAIGATLAAEGAALALCDVNYSGLLQTIAALPASSPSHQVYEVDVAYPDQVRPFVQSAVDHMGQLDVLVNNAGIVDRESRCRSTKKSGTASVPSTSKDRSFSPRLLRST